MVYHHIPLPNHIYSQHYTWGPLTPFFHKIVTLRTTTAHSAPIFIVLIFTIPPLYTCTSPYVLSYHRRLYFIQSPFFSIITTFMSLLSTSMSSIYIIPFPYSNLYASQRSYLLHCLFQSSSAPSFSLHILLHSSTMANTDSLFLSVYVTLHIHLYTVISISCLILLSDT